MGRRYATPPRLYELMRFPFLSAVLAPDFRGEHRTLATRPRLKADARRVHTNAVAPTLASHSNYTSTSPFSARVLLPCFSSGWGCSHRNGEHMLGESFYAAIIGVSRALLDGVPQYSSLEQAIPCVHAAGPLTGRRPTPIPSSPPSIVSLRPWIILYSVSPYSIYHYSYRRSSLRPISEIVM